MVGLSDIPFLGIALDTVSDASIRGLRYLLSYKAIVNDLKNQIEKLSNQKDDVARKVDSELRNGKIIENRTVKWQKEVEHIKSSADELSRPRPSWACFKVVEFTDPVNRFRLGRKAACLSKDVVELTVLGNKLLKTEIACLPYDGEEDATLSDTPYQEFGSREEAYRKLWEALTKEDGHPIIGIYGMPGVGKTRMVVQVLKEAKEKGIFPNVTGASVGSQELNLIKIQDQLAGYLGCHLDLEDDRVDPASQLKHVLKNAGKTLVILDDVSEIDSLNKIGIPFGDDSSMHLKILLTSRSQLICLRNKCKDPLEIKTLTEDEAWKMFQNTVGTSKIESLREAILASKLESLHDLAEKVCKKCAALPLLIYAVGKALESVGKNSWEEALYQLENGKFDVIDGRTAQVYARLQTSFASLTDAQKTCLLLCSLFPQDESIEIKMLFDLATGSGLLDRGTNIYELIDNLKSSSMLLQGKDDYSVKIHDIIRDVARSTAARDPEYAFLYARCKSWLPDIADYPTRRLLHLDLEGENVRFPDDLVCPDLHTLWLQCNSIHSQKYLGGFLKAFKNLKFLLLKGISSSKQQFSIRALEKLSVLILDGCDLDEIFLASIPKNIETLRIWECNIPTPVHLPDLKNLKKFELLVGLKKK